MGDYPDYFTRDVPGQTTHLTPTFQVAWTFTEEQTLVSGTPKTFTCVIPDDGYVYTIDYIYGVILNSFDWLFASYYLNDDPLGNDAKEGSVYLPAHDSPANVGVYGDTIEIDLTQFSGSNKTGRVLIVGTRFAMPAGGFKMPVALFSGVPTSGATPLTVQFTDDSRYNPTSWDWDFGDQTAHVYVKNPSHQYACGGVYSPKLIAANAVGSDTLTKTDYITSSGAPEMPVAAFSGTPTSGDRPLTVQFTDESTGGPTSWDWDFGDGSEHSNDENPSHEYAEYGDYTVTLIVTNACGSDTEIKTDYISCSEITFENLLAYTEVDPSSKITVTSTRVTAIDLVMDETAYVYKDKGANFFDALDIEFVVKLTAGDVAGRIGVLHLANTIVDAQHVTDTDPAVVFRQQSGPAYYIRLSRGLLAATDTYTCSINVPYYCTLLRAAGNDTIELKIYSDEARTNLLHTLSVSGFGVTKHRYIFTISSRNEPDNERMSAYCENIMIN